MLVVVVAHSQRLDGGAARCRLLDADVGRRGGSVEDLCGGAQVGLPVLVRERGGRRRRRRGRRRAHLGLKFIRWIGGMWSRQIIKEHENMIINNDN